MLDISPIEKWCEKNGYETMLVTIILGYEWETPHFETHVLEWECDVGFIWDTDWDEGQHTVELYGFIPLRKIIVKDSFPYCTVWRE